MSAAAREGARRARGRRDGVLLRRRRPAHGPASERRAAARDRAPSTASHDSRAQSLPRRSASRRRRTTCPAGKTIGAGRRLLGDPGRLRVPASSTADRRRRRGIRVARHCPAPIRRSLSPTGPVCLRRAAPGTSAIGGLALILGGVALGTGRSEPGASAGGWPREREHRRRDPAGAPRTTWTSCSS